MPRWSISPSWSSAKAPHGSSTGIGPVDSPSLALRWSIVMQRKSFLNSSGALNTAVGHFADARVQAAAGGDQQREAGADLLVADPDIALLIERGVAAPCPDGTASRRNRLSRRQSRCGGAGGGKRDEMFCGSTWALLRMMFCLNDVLPADRDCRIRDFTTAPTRQAKNLVHLGNAYSTQEGAFGDRAGFVHSRQRLKGSVRTWKKHRREFTAGPLTFTVRHELWDGNIQDHADQGVAIAVTADVAGKETALLRFNCFDFEKSYIYGPENPDLEVAGPEMLGGAALTNLYRMDPIADGNPIGWTIKTLGTKLPKMLERAGYPQIAAATDLGEVASVLPDVEACARELYATKRNTVKHNRGTAHLRSRQHPLRARDAAAADGRRRPRHPRPGRYRRHAGQGLHGRNRAPGLRPLLERRALPLRPAQQEPPHLLGPDSGRGSARVDVGAVRDRKTARR